MVKKAQIRPLSEGIRGYAKALKTEEAITAGRQTGDYLLRGVGAPEKAGPAVLTQQMTRSFIPEAQRQAAAQAAIASIKEQSPSIPLTMPKAALQTARTLLTGGPRGVGEITDLAAALGGGSLGQRIAQRTGRAVGASQQPFR